MSRTPRSRHPQTVTAEPVRRLLVVGLVLGAALVTTACGDEPGSFTEGQARHPDVAGVVDTATPTAITIDGTRYPLAEELSSFSTYTLEPIPLRQRVGQYVHAGLDGDGRVVWVAAVGAVLPGTPPVVLYSGRMRSVEDGTATFEDGTVLPLGPDVTPPGTLPAFVHVRIDADRDHIRSLNHP